MPGITIKEIREALAGPLPGLRGQALMAPGYRPLDQKSYEEGSKTCRRAAVLLLLYPLNDQLYTVLTERQRTLSSHPGQVSLPGGSRDGGETVTETAIREAYEEIGVNPETVEILGRLTHIYIRPSHFCIQIVVGYAANPPQWRPNPDEVECLLEVPLSRFFDPNLRRTEIIHRQERDWLVPYFAINDLQVWGATAMALGEFVTLLSENYPQACQPPFWHQPIYEHPIAEFVSPHDLRGRE
ncbi:MAG: CoA pyrophosphatase [Clostridia bacterium]|nr:MAG: CoA pyrophosphatase [Clostridia bacterium]